MKTTIGILVMAGLAATGSGQLQLTEVFRTSVAAAAGEGNAWFIGRNLSSVAWDGTNLYVGGQSFNTAGSAIAKVTPQAGTTAGLFQLAGNFGFQATAATRGIQDLAISPTGLLAVATDNGANAAFGYRLFDANGNFVTNSAFNVRGNGVDFDPINGVAAGVVLGSGRLHGFNNDGSVFNPGTGNWDSATGPLVFSTSSTNRDSEFDSDGNLYYRQQNSIHRISRTGAGTFGAPTLLKASGVDNVNGQNLEVIEGFGSDVIIFGNRLSTAAGQSFTNVIQAIDSSGVAVTLQFNFSALLGGAPATGAGYYDFSYHAASQTLAVADFTNNTVHIFRVPAPASAALLGLGGFAAMRRRR